MAARFYAENLGISEALGARVAGFMTLAHLSSAVINPKPWAKPDKVRVYFEPWSQNNLRVFHLADKWFYDAVENEVYATGFFYGTMNQYLLSKLVTASAGNFSGAKTKARLVKFSEVFYGQKANWD